MKGNLLDFKTVEDAKEFSGLSDQVLRNLKDGEMVLQMFSQSKPTISIGFDDTKAPYFDEGVKHYRSQGYQVGIRGAGGRSVANDQGILNFSLIYKVDAFKENPYHVFHQFIQDALKPLGLNFELGQIDGAYCPGLYDISLSGRKVAGTSSRIVQGNSLVGCYLGVNGDQEKRSKVISEFYEITQDVIRVDPNKLTTIQDALGKEITVEEVKQLLVNQFKTMVTSLEDYDTSKISQEAINQSIDRMQVYNRNYLK